MKLEAATELIGGGLGVVLGWWGGGDPWLGGSGGLSVAGLDLGSFTWRCFTPEEPHLPSVMGVFFLCF